MLAENINLQEAGKVRKQLAKRAETKTIKADQETKEKLDRSASSPTPKMPGMHQPSTFSRNKLATIFILGLALFGNDAVTNANHCVS